MLVCFGPQVAPHYMQMYLHAWHKLSLAIFTVYYVYCVLSMSTVVLNIPPRQLRLHAMSVQLL